ncbi:Carbamoyltransferase HypF2 [Candidatus Desulfarcum epimagneticum]|uniref:Carbamoyltransferase n=1 Tax=uncultured Desulfobacteraceae bacterium TaxID=218296 RepID=A0A484HFV0_9BACT|nr:Carbamoyltransferase HypF2 [uncultured Desulfobacteraceae bacterium]
MSKPVASKTLAVNGIVQGVGFRPFIHQLAGRFGLKGEVANTSAGVFIHIEGPADDVDLFCRRIEKNPPPLSRITHMAVSNAPPKGYETFSIVKSRGRDSISTLISPDVSVCEDCLSELFDPEDRRYLYPFLNCVNCGPRYTIIDDIPYDRPHTSMKGFDMCDACRREYEDPANRRFHAQPNACPECGPHVALYNASREKIPGPDPIEKTARLLKEGHILAIKGLGGFHLAADPENDAAVKRLREKKGREEKPFALMSPDMAAIEAYAHVSDAEKKRLNSLQRPIVILRKKIPTSLSEAVSPKNDSLGVMLPCAPLHYLLFQWGFKALVMTSGNISEEPIVIDNETAFSTLGNIADYFLIHNRDIYLRSDDSIVRHSAGATRLIRRSRGYAPAPIFLKKSVPPTLACGAHMKNTVCLAKGQNAFLSQHIGDLENRWADDFFRMTIDHMKRIFDIHWEIAACDLHPDYSSSRYAKTLEERGARLVRVQHHHAHIASCMAENQIDSKVIGIALDGAGLGSDGAIWGGEALVADLTGFERSGKIEYNAMPGGDAAAREPWRMALSYLHEAFGDSMSRLSLPLIRHAGEKKIRVIQQMINGNIHSPPTSSAGRLFDGVASIIGIRHISTFEGQAAMELEMAAAGEKPRGVYPCQWIGEKEKTLPTAPIIRAVVADMEKGASPSQISAKFHATLIQAFCDLCQIVKKETGIDQAALSGGVFQNRVLLSGMKGELEKRGFEVFCHSLAPCNDGGLSLGQAAIAAAQCAG